MSFRVPVRTQEPVEIAGYHRGALQWMVIGSTLHPTGNLMTELQIPANYLYRIVCCTTVVITSAVVANRNISFRLYYTGDADSMFEAVGSKLIPASTTKRFTSVPGIPDTAEKAPGAGVFPMEFMAIPDVYYDDQCRIRFGYLAGTQVGDFMRTRVLFEIIPGSRT